MVRRSHKGGPAKYARPQDGAVFRRARLFRELVEQRHHACTWIKGPPGCGKTTLIADYVSELGDPCLWYRIDADDADPATFFAHLTIAARAELGDAANDLPSFSVGGSATSVESFARAYFRTLFAATSNLMVVLCGERDAQLFCGAPTRHELRSHRPGVLK